MPVMTPVLGKSLDIYLLKATTYGVAPTGNYVKTPVYSFALAAARPLEADPILGVARDNSRDATPPAPGLTSHSGSVEVPLDLRHIGYWLGLVFGAPVTTEDTDVFTHVFESGKSVIPDWTVVQQVAAAGGAEYRRHVGVVARTLAFALGQEAGYRRLTVELGGRNASKVVSAGTGTVPAMLDRSPFPAAKGVLKLGGVTIANLLGFEGTYDNAFEEERLVDESDMVSGWGPGENEASFTGNLRLRYTSDTFEALGESAAPQAITLEYKTSDDMLLRIEMPSVTFERAGLPVNGPGRIEQQVGFRAAQTDAEPMLTVTLINDVEDYAEAA